MALRSIWKGSIHFSLVSVPVEAYTAAERDEGEIHLNQLHDECHSRIRYKKTCPVHGEVTNDQIVTGYEYEKDHYVIVDRNEVEKAQADDRAITIDTFISPEDIDPIYYDGRTYYLAPSVDAAAKPYLVLTQAMEKIDRWGVATLVLHGKEQLLLIRPVEGVLTMTMLHYKSQVRSPDMLRDEVPQGKANAQELKLAEQLIASSTAEKFDFAAYEDRYTDRLKELIEAKLKGKEIVAPPEHDEEIPVINLMDALKKSVQQRKRGGGGLKSTAAKKASRHIPRPAARRRKSS